MQRKRQDLLNKRFGRLTVVARAPKDGKCRRAARWFVRCDCGTEKIVEGPNLYKGNTKSCGCLRRDMGRRLLKKAHQKTGV